MQENVNSVSKETKAGELVNYRLSTVSGVNQTNQFAFFESVGELVKCVHENNPAHLGGNDTWNDSTNTYRLNPKGIDAGFYGRPEWCFGSANTIENTRDLLSSGAATSGMIAEFDASRERIERDFPELADIRRSAKKSKRKRKFSEDGAELNIDKYMSGDVEMWATMVKRPQVRSLRVLFNASLSSRENEGRFF